MNFLPTTPRGAFRLAFRLALIAGAIAVLYFYGKAIVIILCAIAALLLFGAMVGPKKPKSRNATTDNDPLAELKRRGGAIPPALHVSLGRPPGIDL